MSWSFPKNIPRSSSRRFCLSHQNFMRHQTTSAFPSTLDPNHTVSKKTNINDQSKDDNNTLTEFQQLYSLHGILHTSQDRIFQSSDFRSLSLSGHGSLIQDDQTQKSDQNNYANSMEYFHDEEELNVNFMTDAELAPSKHKRNSFKYAMQRNPAETKHLKKVKKYHDSKVVSSSITEFYEKIIGSERSVKDYNAYLPQFPNDTELNSFKQYLVEINAIDLSYDSNGYQSTLYLQMNELLKNVYKFDGLVDIDIMHEFLKFFSNYPTDWKIFKIINKFENLGIVPNRNTLHLLIYKLNSITNPVHKKKLLDLYLDIGIEKWKISTDLTTQVLIHDLEKPSKKRMALAKSLINEGVDNNILQWSIYEDYIAISLNNTIGKGHKTNFTKTIEYFTRMNFIEENTDMKKLFQIYIKALTQINQYTLAMDELSKNNQYVTTECWNIVNKKLLDTNQIWNCFAVINLIESRPGIDHRRIIFTLLHDYRTIYEHFTKQDMIQNNKILFCYVMKYLQDQIDVEMVPLTTLINKLIKKNGPFDDQVYDKIKTDFRNLKFWKSIDRNYDCYSSLFYNGPISIKKLWRVHDIEDGRQHVGMVSIDPVLFPWT